MKRDLLDSQRRLNDSLFELYMQGGFELMMLGTRGLKRELIIDLETSVRPPISSLEHSYQSCPASGSNLNND